ADGKLHESDYTNDAASLRIRIDWPDGTDHKPALQILGTCPDTATCPGPAGSPPPSGKGNPPPPPPPEQPPIATVSGRSATRWARRAVRHSVSYRPRRLRASCRRKSKTRFRCRARWRHAHHRHATRIGVWHSTSD